MVIQQRSYTKAEGWKLLNGNSINGQAIDLVLGFGSVSVLSDPALFAGIKETYPHAQILLSSTAGEIIDTQVNDETLSLTAISFNKTLIKAVSMELETAVDSFSVARKLAAKLDPKQLTSVMVISDGLKINGSDLVQGLRESLPEGVLITGGLAGDGARFQHTLVGLNEAPVEGRIAAIGFYGNSLLVTYGSVGGWDSFGPERLITKANANVLYELDNKPALDIYKAYLGDYANELPMSGLLFPLSIRTNGPGSTLVRTILAVNEADKSLTFAGNMPVGKYARLMKANTERLIEGASKAAQNSREVLSNPPDLALLISCVGRKLVLDQRIEEEIEVVRAIYGDSTAIAGFYSYGEISPSGNFMKCELHNQTMTITTFTETKDEME